jgi:glycerol-3-phosphate dehydrogenase (NAD(P)+)
VATEVARELHHPRLRLYSSSDPVGVEVAGALKNVIAIAAGMSDAMGLGLNARAALITRGLAEIRRLGERLGARSDTFLGLAGVGDLTLTCTATLSRNYRVGQSLAQGRPLAGILADLGEVAEGVSTARAVPPIAAAVQAEMPISSAVLAVVEGRHAPAEALQLLLARDPQPES